MWLRMTFLTMVTVTIKTIPLKGILVEGEHSWGSSLNICINNYTDIVTIYGDDDDKQLQQLQQQLNKTSLQISVWFGLKRSKYLYKWSNGDPVHYLNTSSNQCN